MFKMDCEEILIKEEITDETESDIPNNQEEQDKPDYINVNTLYQHIIKLENSTVNQMFHCNECGRKYKVYDSLQIHKAVHDPQKHCPICKVDLSLSKKKLHIHINQHIKEKSIEEKLIFSCEFCQKQFDRHRRYIEHVRVHTNERPYKCNFCEKAFKQTGGLRDHQRTHTNDRQYHCEVCNGDFTTSSSLKRHKKNMHEKGKSYTCKNCDEIFTNMNHYKSHKANVHPELTFQRKCPFCSEIFHSRPKYKAHRQTHAGLIKLKNCTLCAHVNVSFKDILEHKRKHMHYTEQELEEAIRTKCFKCKVCSCQYNTKECLFRHMNAHEKKETECTICKVFFTFRGYKIHMRLNHQYRKCRFCNKVTIGSRSLYYHYDQCHKDIKNKYQCSVCKRKYITRLSLRIHFKNMHEANGVQNLKCNICGRSFLSRQSLSSHMYAKHNKKANFTRREQQRCIICNKIFKSVALFAAHAKECSQHNIIKKSRKINRPDSDDYVSDRKCDICGKILYCASGLVRHRLLHLNIIHDCKFCDRKFREARTLRKHIQKFHINQKTFYCDECELGFLRYRDLVTHKSDHSQLVQVKNEIQSPEYEAGCSTVPVKEEQVYIKEELS